MQLFILHGIFVIVEYAFFMWSFLLCILDEEANCHAELVTERASSVVKY